MVATWSSVIRCDAYKHRRLKNNTESQTPINDPNKKKIKFSDLPLIGTGWQLLNASPVKPSAQLQSGVWFTTRQTALVPQDPGQGSTHFLLTHVWADGQSELTMHSGRQFGAVPIILGIHWHFAAPDTTWQIAFAPHGGGLHGFEGNGGGLVSSGIGGRMTAATK